MSDWMTAEGVKYPFDVTGCCYNNYAIVIMSSMSVCMTPAGVNYIFA